MTLATTAARLAELELLESVKTVALCRGLRIADEVVARLGGERNLTIHEYATTGGMTLELPHGVLINAPFDEPYCASSPLELIDAGDGLVLRMGQISVPIVRVIPLPGYLTALAGDGEPVQATTMSHADRIRVSPIDGCSFDCRFCNMPGSYRTRPLSQIIAALDVALEDAVLPARHLLISGGSPSFQPRQQDYFAEMCVGIARHVRAVTADRTEPFEIDIMMSACPGGPAFIDRVLAAGVSGFSLNIEVYSDGAARRHLPLKHKLARPHLQAMIEHAVAILGRESGRVRSLIIPGLEPSAATLAGIEWLASLGCHPVLSPFRPARRTALAHSGPLDPDELSEILARAREIVARHGVTLGPRCIPCQHNTLSFPWDQPVRESHAPV